MLDDSLSSVDAETERAILKHLRDVMHGRTAVLISHRVAAIKDADQILVLDQGKIVARGTHDELLAQGGTYGELYRTQLDTELTRPGGELMAATPPARRRAGRSAHVRRTGAPRPARARRVLGKAYDLALMRRLWPFVRPHVAAAARVGGVHADHDRARARAAGAVQLRADRTTS